MTFLRCDGFDSYIFFGVVRVLKSTCRCLDGVFGTVEDKDVADRYALGEYSFAGKQRLF